MSRITHAQSSIMTYTFVVLLMSFNCIAAFAPPLNHQTRTATSLLATKEPLRLTTNPTPSAIANLATTPNHSETKTGTWSETIPTEQTRIRFIVEGEGSIALTSANGETARQRITPGSFVEIEAVGGEAQLVWDVDDKMEILYSGEILDEQQTLAAGLLGLILGSGGLAHLASKGM